MSEEKEQNPLKTSDKISSNIDFIKEYMQNIDNTINDCTSYCENNHSFNSSAEANSLYSSINNVLNIYYKAQIKLMEKISKETNSIIKIGERYKDLDDKLSSKAGEL